MNKNIDELANLIMYSGQSIHEVINEAVKSKNSIGTNKFNDGSTELIVESIITYNVKVVDRYIYDLDGKLIKQYISINGKEKLIFDKYKEILSKVEEKENIA
jgi:arsenate reductase-like glutaredoxin family protein